MSTENLRKMFVSRDPKERLRTNLGRVLRKRSPKEWAWLCLDTEDWPQKVHPVWGRRIGQWRLEVPTDGLPGDERVGGMQVPLTYALLRMNRAPANHRYPVLFQDKDAVVELFEWLAEKDASGTVPIVKVRIGRGQASDLRNWACWLDAAQIDVLRSVSQDGRPGIKSAWKSGTFATLPSGEQLKIPSAEEFSQGNVEQRYDYLPTRWIPPSNADGDLAELAKRALNARDGYEWQVMASRDDRDRTRQTNVWIDSKAAEAAQIEKSGLVAVWPVLYHGWRGRHIAALARCEIVDDLGTPQGNQNRVPYLQADQIVREAIGVEIGEKVVITPCRTGAVPFGGHLLNYMLGKPSYVTCRVQTADTSSVERECCLVDELTLGLLGVESGDTVVIEAVPRKAVPPDADSGNHHEDRDNKVSSNQLPVQIRCLRVKAFKIGDEALRQRFGLIGGDLTSRFPSSRDSLGVFPDLPWIFLDKSARLFLDLADQELGSDQKLGVVRVRASRRYQSLKEARAMLVVVAVSSITVLAIFKTATPQWVTVGVLFTLLTWLILWSMHDRLTRVFRKWPKKRD